MGEALRMASTVAGVAESRCKTDLLPFQEINVACKRGQRCLIVVHGAPLSRG